MASVPFFKFYWSIVVIISAIQHSDQAIHIHISIISQILFPLRLSQNTGGIPCAKVPIGRSFHIPQCAYANPKPPVHPSSHPIPVPFGKTWVSNQHFLMEFSVRKMLGSLIAAELDIVNYILQLPVTDTLAFLRKWAQSRIGIGRRKEHNAPVLWRIFFLF